MSSPMRPRLATQRSMDCGQKVVKYQQPRLAEELMCRQGVSSRKTGTTTSTYVDHLTGDSRVNSHEIRESSLGM